MFKRLFSAGLVFGAAALAPPLAEAQPLRHCADRESVVAQLEDRFGERRILMGLQSRNSLLEVWGSDASGSFTVIITRADSTSCVVASGTHLVLERLKPPEREASH